MDKCYVGFDCSNYTTSIAACDESGRIIANLKMPLPVKEGERGLRQSDAVFAHVKNLPELIGRLSSVIYGKYEPIAVGVSATPRDAEGSYMPCFLSGIAAAHSFAAASSLPIYEFSHQSGHIMAAAYSSGESERLLSDRFLAFHVSGGTTEALLVTPKKCGFDVLLVGETLDINAGQLIDRVGVALGLKFPCGAQLEKLALAYDGEIPKIKTSVHGGRCNLSGAENQALKLYDETGSREACARFVFEFVMRTLMKMADGIMERNGKLPILFAGGVMSNSLMRETLSKRFDASFASPEYSSDNAAGVCLLCREAAKNI